MLKMEAGLTYSTFPKWLKTTKSDPYYILELGIRTGITAICNNPETHTPWVFISSGFLLKETSEERQGLPECLCHQMLFRLQIALGLQMAHSVPSIYFGPQSFSYHWRFLLLFVFLYRRRRRCCCCCRRRCFCCCCGCCWTFVRPCPAELPEKSVDSRGSEELEAPLAGCSIG